MAHEFFCCGKFKYNYELYMACLVFLRVILVFTNGIDCRLWRYYSDEPAISNLRSYSNINYDNIIRILCEHDMDNPL